MTTGAPIYLVSACGSGEEFVAAFRRYADKAGLFIPMAEPLPAGRKGRFALTLSDGGVMVEGDAEVISSGATPSLLHGRVGMTLRFVDPDERTRTVLVELEKARLAMRPPPPSVPPRPAEIPAQPRAVPPPPGGRIDLHNAKAQCVAIGDVEQLQVVDKPAAKAGPRFVVPAIPPMGAGRGRTTSAPPPLPPQGPRPAAPEAESTGPAVIHDAPPPSPASAPPPTPISERFVRVRQDSEQTTFAPPPSPPPSPRAAPPSAPPPLAELALSRTRTLRDSEQTAARTSEPSPASGPAGPQAFARPMHESEQRAPRPSARDSSAPPPRPAAGSAPPPRPSPPPQAFARPMHEAEQRAARTVRDSEQTAAAAAPELGLMHDSERTASSAAPHPHLRPPSDDGDQEQTATGPAPAPAHAPAPAGSPRTRAPRDSDEQTAAGPAPAPPIVPAQGPATLAVHAAPLADGPAISRTATEAGHAPAPSPVVSRTATTAGPAPAPRPSQPPPFAGQRAIRDSEETAIVGRAEASSPVATPMEIASEGSNGATTRSPAPSDAVPMVIGMPTPPEPMPVVARTATPPRKAADDEEPTDLSAVPQVIDSALAGLTIPESHIKSGKRRTVLGMPVSASGASDVRPAAPSTPPPFGVAADADNDKDKDKATAAAVEEHTPSGDWTFAPGDAGPTIEPRVDKRDKLPTGDWTIQLAGDTWSEPSKPDAVPVTAAKPAAKPAPATPAAPAAPAPQPAAPVEARKPKPAPAPAPVKSGERPPGPPQSFVSGSHESAPASTPPPSAEPKIQIDPTLIEPLQPMPPEPAPMSAAMPGEPSGGMPAGMPAARTSGPHLPALGMPPEGMPAHGGSGPHLPAGAMPPHGGSGPHLPPGAMPPHGSSGPHLPPAGMPAPGGSGPHLPAIGMSPPPGGELPPQPYPSGAYAIDPAHAMQVGGFPQATGPQVAFGPQSTGPHPYPPAPQQTAPHPAFPPVPTGQHVAFPPVPTGQHGAFPPVPTGQYGPPRTKRPTKPPRPAASRILVIAASALLVAVFGGAAYIVFGGLDEDDDATTFAPKPAPSGVVDAGAGSAANAAPGDASAMAPAPPPGEGSATEPANPAHTTAVPPAAAGSAGGCVVEVTSNPSGAEVVLDTTVLGVTPAQVPLPCEAPVKLLVRKATYVAQQRAVTPARDGSEKLKIALVHVSYAVKVSSSPPGATITMNGKSLGTTPATIKLPAFEAATLTIAKDGFSTETEHVTPKTNNTTVHSILKKAPPPKRLK